MRDDPAQKCCRLAHGIAVEIEPAQEGVLDHVLRVRNQAQHPVGDADEARPQRIEDGGRLLAEADAIRQPPR